jgi:hypothetical protein
MHLRILACVVLLWSCAALADGKQERSQQKKSNEKSVQEAPSASSCADVFIESGGPREQSGRSLETSAFQFVEGPDNALRRVFVKLTCLLASV